MDGNTSQGQIARNLNVSLASVQQWISNYESMGADIFSMKGNKNYSNNGCTRQAANPQYIAENILNREFTSEAPNERWLTDVTEFKYYDGIKKHKVYLSAILDLYYRRIVSYIIRDSNNNALVFDTQE